MALLKSRIKNIDEIKLIKKADLSCVRNIIASKTPK